MSNKIYVFHLFECLNVEFQKISIPTPRKVNGNSKGEGGSKAQFLKGKYGTKMEFLDGVGVQARKPSVGGVWLFSGTTQ